MDQQTQSKEQISKIQTISKDELLTRINNNDGVQVVKVKAYEGGIKEWSEAGLPMDK